VTEYASMAPYITPNSDAYNAALKTVLPGGVHHNFRGTGDPAPVRLVGGSGSRLVDLDGNEYLDLSAAQGALSLGHQNEEFVDALKDQMGRVVQVVNSDLELTAAQAVRRWFPSAEMMRFGLSGTEVISNAIRLARAFTGRQKVLRFGGHYHGSSDLLLGGLPPSEPGAPLLPPSDAFDTEGRAEGIQQRECLMARWNDVDGMLATIEAFAPSIACVVMEPICINGGGIAMNPDFAAAVADSCRSHGIILIMDEIITGIRAGPGGAQARFGLVPDLFVTGKAISNGIPISVLAGRAEIMRLLSERRVIHGGTYNGYPLGLRAIIATVDILARDDFAAVKQAETMTARIADLFLELAAQLAMPFHVNRFGTAAVLHPGPPCDDPLRYGSLSASLSARLLTRTLQQHGVLLCPVSRCYLTPAFGEADLVCLGERAHAALAAAGRRIAQLAAVNQ
jgi:glutamate-1-semialdehyde 2,1-aminomutase